MSTNKESRKSASSSKAKKRLNIDLNQEAYELLQKLSDESGKNMTEILRTGLALYGIAHDEKRKGRDLAVVEETNEANQETKVVSKIITT